MANDHDVAFPILSDRDIEALAARGHPREVHAGDLLFEEGDRNPPFFVVQKGAERIGQAGVLRCRGRSHGGQLRTCAHSKAGVGGTAGQRVSG